MRRLNIACGIAHRPEIIILDEPTVAVDPQSRNNILEGIKKLNQEGSTIIYTSHYMEEVHYLCDDIVIIDKGRVIAKGTSNELREMIQVNEKISFVADNLSDQLINKLKNMDHIIDFSYKEDTCKMIFSKSDEKLLSLVEILTESKVEYRSINVEKPSLNDVILELAGKDLRD